MAQTIREDGRNWRVSDGLRVERVAAGSRDALKGRMGVGWVAFDDERGGIRRGWYASLFEASLEGARVVT